MFIGIHYSVRVDDIMTHFMYRAELCFKLCAEASIRVRFYFAQTWTVMCQNLFIVTLRKVDV